MNGNVITANFRNGQFVHTDPLWQYDYGQVLRFTGVALPETFEVHFSNAKEFGQAKTSIGTTDGVLIPDEYLVTGKPVFAWIFLHTGADDGETVYMAQIPVNKRSVPSDEAPTPQEQSAITQAIAALNSAVVDVQEAVEAADSARASASSAGASATAAAASEAGVAEDADRASAAATAAESAQGAAEAAQAGAETAQTGAESARDEAAQASAAQIAQINATGAAVLESIPADYTKLSDSVSNLKSDTERNTELSEQSKLEITGEINKVIAFESGLYNTNGYVVNSAWMRSQKLGAGTYTVTPPSGYRYAGYSYVSDSSGTELFSGRTMAYSFTATGPFILDFGKAAGGILTQEDINAIKAGFVLVQTQTSNINSRLSSVTTLADKTATKFEKALSDGNLFDHKTASYGTTLLNNGDTSPQAMAITTDYIDVHDVDQIWMSGTPNMLCAYDSSKTFQFYLSAPTSPKSMIVNGVHAYYIRVAFSGPAVAEGFMLTATSKQTDKYGFFPTIGISGVNIDKELAEWVHNNGATARNPDWENIGDDYTVTWRGCSGYTDHRKVFGRPKSVYIVNNVNTLADAVFTPTSTINAVGICKIKVTVYVPDVTLVSSMTVALLGTSWSRSTSALTNGLNEIEFFAHAGTITTWDTITGIRVYMSGTAGLSFCFIDCEFWRPEKAIMILVEDGGYKTYLDVAYPQLKALGVPTTWALNPGRLGDNTDPNRFMISQEDIDALADDPFSEFSFHSWAAEVGAELSGAELATYAQKCINYLRKHGLAPEHLWRAAHTQNNAPNYAGEIGLVEALATGTQATAYIAWPFPDPWNVPRILIHGRADSWYDTFFDTLKKTHCCAVIYTHGIDDASASMTSVQLEYFLGKLETAMEEGWLNPTTYNRLKNEEQ